MFGKSVTTASLPSIRPKSIRATKGITVNGQPVLGALDFVLSPQHPDRGSRKEWFNLVRSARWELRIA